MILERPPSALPGVRYGAVERHADERGSFRELWRADTAGSADIPNATSGSDPGGDLASAHHPEAATAPYVQVNLSTSATGVLRGLHLHRRQRDYWVVASGRAFVALVDVRPMLVGSASVAPIESRELLADDWVVIPEGVAHGFLALEPLDMVYLVTNLYDGTDELGFAWDDPAVGVPWPVVGASAGGRPLVSGRDASNPPLSGLVARLRAEQA